MWIINFLIYASVLLISILLAYLVISFFPRAKRQINFFDKKTPLYEKTAFYISNLVSIASLIISLRTYNDSLQASVNQNKVNDSTRTALERVVKLIAIQTKTLNSSKASLQSVVELTRKQQKILDANLAVSKEQYKNIRERNDQDRKIAAYKPDLQIEISLFGMFYTAKDFVKDSGNDWLKLSLEKSFLNSKIPASVRLENKGKVNAKGVVMLLTPLLFNTVSIEKITGLNPPYDHSNDELHVDVAEFYDYHQTEIPVSNNPFSIFRPEYKFNILPTALNSAIKIEVILTNGDSKILILFIAME